MRGSSPCQRFTIFDAMLMVIAASVGLALIRWANPRGDWFSARIADLMTWIWGGPPSCLAVGLGLGMILASCRPPRARWRRLARQPGFIASIMAVGTIPVHMLLARAAVAVERPPPGMTYLYPSAWYWDSAAAVIPMTVGGSWVALKLTGRWRPVASWTDRLGRLVGIFWLAFWPIRLIHPFLALYFPSRF